MINLQKLAQYQESLGYLGQQINFPEKLTFHPNVFQETIEASHPAYELSLIHISEPTRPVCSSRMPSSA